MQSIHFPETITNIQWGAFIDCAALLSMDLPHSLTAISDNAFLRCTSLKSVIIPNSVNSVSSGNGMGIFGQCSNLESVIFEGGSSLKTLMKNMFNATPKLKTVVLPDSLEEISESAFDNSGIESINIPDNVKLIDRWAFCGCTSLKEVTFSSGSRLQILGSNCFSNCPLLTSLNLPSSLTTINSNGLSGIAAKSIILPLSVTTINKNAFCNNEGLIIYCEATEKPLKWHIDWLQEDVYDSLYAKPTVYWYSDIPNYDGSHWHYVGGIPTIWVE